MLKKSLYNITIFILILAVLSGCKIDDSKNGGYLDALGNFVELPKNPKRVVALTGSFAEVWQLAGGEVLGTVSDAWEELNLKLDGAYCIGGAHTPSAEKILSLSPDFIIASASVESNIELLSVLTDANIPIVFFNVDNFDDYLDMLRVLTKITGRDDLYKKNGTDVKLRIDKIKENSINSDKILLLRASSGGIKAKNSKGTVLGEMLCELGCINIADSDEELLENLSVESVIKNEPYRIFVVTMGSDTKKAIDNLTKMIENNPAWSSLDAVKNNRIHIMERRLFNIKPNAMWADAYEKLTKILCEK